MATAAKKDQMVECGFCGRKNEALKEPKTLPCKHVHCFGCPVKCSIKGCGEVVDISLTNLPSHDTSDVCAKKGKSHQEADSYCIQCEKGLCTMHQECDIVSGYKETKDEIPTLNIPKCTSLSTRDKSRDIELDILSVEGVQIDGAPGETTPISPPKSLTLLKTVNFPDNVTSVFGYEGNTYVGSYGGVVTKVDAGFGLSPFFDFHTRSPGCDKPIKCLDKHVGGFYVHRDSVYSIAYGNYCSLYLHDLSGEQLVKGGHKKSPTDNFLGLAVCSGQLVVPDKKRQQLVVYNSFFLEVKRISCAQKLGNYWICLCAVGDNNVVVSDHQSSQVFKVNISTGAIEWTCADVGDPRGVTCYRDQYVLVAGRNNILIILDIHTGKVVSTQSMPASSIYPLDMHISGDTLALADYTGKCVHFFRLNP